VEFIADHFPAMNAFSVATSVAIVVKRRGSASRPARRAGRGASLPIAARTVSLNFRRQRRLENDHRASAGSRGRADLERVGGVRGRSLRRSVVHGADRRQAVGRGAAPAHEAERRRSARAPRASSAKTRASSTSAKSARVRAASRPSASKTKRSKFDSLRDVHRRARRLVRLGGACDAVDAGAEELVEDVVLVGREHQAADRQAHAARDVAGADVAEVAGRHGEVDLLVVARVAWKQPAK
jgi:hypothetical protein